MTNGSTKPSVILKTAVRIRSRATHNSTEGVPWIWVCAGALVTILLMIFGMFGIILTQGLSALWPHTVIETQYENQLIVGIATRQEEGTAANTNARVLRQLIFQGNRDFSTNEFAFIPAEISKSAKKPHNIWFIERREWGTFIGKIFSSDENRTKELSNAEVKELIQSAASRASALQSLEKGELAELNAMMEDLRLQRKTLDRKVELGVLSFEQSQQKTLALDEQLQGIEKRHSTLSEQVQKIRSEDEKIKVKLVAPNGQSKTIPASQLLRAYKPNEVNLGEKIVIFLKRLWSFVSDEPREANTEGGVFPALFGTIAMTLIMTVSVLPVGVMTAVYMREIAKQGALVSLVRIAVNNLAGVPSIVYGVFGVGFFCYSLGVSIDQLFFQDKLPNPTFGTGGILWASLTLSLLTVPVVIVSTEEALSAVPRSLREASYGCGATRMQTLWNIVLPKALPGVMTGLILAMARAVGEVAPLLMTGVVKLAPALPVDAHFPYVHLERSFMHLGFHIYDLGFQSRSTELSRPMVFASTSLLVAVVLLLNFVAIKIRSQLRKRFEGRGAF